VDLAATLGSGEQPRKFYQALCEKLYAYAEWDFRNGRKLGDGATEGQHKTSAAKQMEALGWKTAASEVLIPPPEFPHAIAHVWQWFHEVVRGVQGNGMSYPVITWTELDCWARLTQQEISPREAKTIIVLGTMHANIMSEKTKTDAA
jgi:hypothetical protein